MKKIATCMLLACLFAGSASAQVLKYDNDDELMGAAIASPTSADLLLQRLVQKCAAFNDSLRTSGDQALRAWEERHQDYLDENRRVRAQLESMYRNDPKAQAGLRDMLEKQAPVVLEKQYQAFAAPIDAMPTEAAKVGICNSYVQAITDKKFDLKTNDPALSAFLDKRIQARSGTK
jgi:hypothetical protein